MLGPQASFRKYEGIPGFPRRPPQLTARLILRKLSKTSQGCLASRKLLMVQQLPPKASGVARISHRNSGDGDPQLRR